MQLYCLLKLSIFTDTLFFTWIWITILCHLFSVWRTYFSISYVRLASNLFFQVPLILKYLYVLKDSFAGYWILGWQDLTLSTLNTIFRPPLFLMSAVNLICDELFSSCCFFNIFSLSLTFSVVTMIYLSVDLFMFILPEVHCAYLMYRLMSMIKFGKISAMTPNSFYAPFSPFSPLCICWCTK